MKGSSEPFLFDIIYFRYGRAWCKWIAYGSSETGDVSSNLSARTKFKTLGEISGGLLNSLHQNLEQWLCSIAVAIYKGELVKIQL